MTAPSPRLSGRALLAAALLVLLHLALAWHSTLQRSLTVDEIFHITGGFFFDKYGDYRIHPDNGVLPQRMHALPAVLLGAKPPPMEGNDQWRSPNMFTISRQFYHESGNDSRQMLLGARAMNLIFSAAVCVLIFAWARHLGGDLAGFAALILAVFSPTMLAHGPLATTDMASAFFLPASAGAFWWQLRQPSWSRTLLSAALFGLACVVKYSAALLIPIFLLLAAVHFVWPGETPRRFKAVALGIGAHALVAWLIIWTCFGFRFSGFSPEVPPADQFVAPWDYIIRKAGWQGEIVGRIKDARLFPEAFLFGYLNTYVGSLSRGAFLAGEHGTSGWVAFFPLAFLWKSTFAELAGVMLCTIAAILGWRTSRGAWLKFAPLFILAGVYGVVALASHLNIGQRHLLPLYPLLFIAIGATVVTLGRASRYAIAGFACIQLATAASIHPYSLAYFNTLAGGPANGWRLLVDSSLDWGQDLPALRRWLETNNAGPAPQPAFLSYFGMALPAREGVPVAQFFSLPDIKEPTTWHTLTGGIYCISATNIQEVYNPAQGAWTLEAEKEYQALDALEADWRAFFGGDPAVRARMLGEASADSWERGWRRHMWLRHARLTAYLRARTPDATAGYSILIFRLTDAEVKTALHSPFSEWAAAIETLASRARH